MAHDATPIRFLHLSFALASLTSAPRPPDPFLLSWQSQALAVCNLGVEPCASSGQVRSDVSQGPTTRHECRKRWYFFTPRPLLTNHFATTQTHPPPLPPPIHSRLLLSATHPTNLAITSVEREGMGELRKEVTTTTFIVAHHSTGDPL